MLRFAITECYIILYLEMLMNESRFEEGLDGFKTYLSSSISDQPENATAKLFSYIYICSVISGTVFWGRVSASYINGTLVLNNPPRHRLNSNAWPFVSWFIIALSLLSAAWMWYLYPSMVQIAPGTYTQSCLNLALAVTIRLFVHCVFFLHIKMGRY